MPDTQWNTLRDRALQKVFNIPENEVLNQDLRQHTIPVRTTNFSIDLLKIMEKLLSKPRLTPSGSVDYKAIKEDNLYQFEFMPLTNQLIYFNPLVLNTMEERLSFWINLYNAMILNAVIEYNIQESVTEGKWGATAFFQRAAYLVFQERISADDIEHGILRANQGHLMVPGKQFSQEDPRHNWVIFPMEPRIHFALHCASVSSPPLRVYHPDKIDAQLNTAMIDVIQRDTLINVDELTITLPNMIKWAQRDLGGQDKILEVLTYALPEKASILRKNFERWKLKFNTHDWSLNQQ